MTTNPGPSQHPEQLEQHPEQQPGHRPGGHSGQRPGPTPLRRLPVSAVPAGTPAWTAERARRWTRALPPAWVPLRPRPSQVLIAVCVTVPAGFLLNRLADLHPLFAALLSLQSVWTLVRPELVRLTAPALLALPVWPPSGWTGTVATALVLAATAVLSEVRLRARRGQRAAALASAADVTAELPDARKPVRRGRFLLAAGGLLLLLGVVLTATVPGWAPSGGRGPAWLAAFLVAGHALTVFASGVVGRRRATALARVPAPVLRVLVREDGSGDTEVYAADDEDAVRPLFTVYGEQSDDEDDEDDGETEEDALSDEELDRIVDALDDDGPGPLREAVLYGSPYDGAEILLVSAPDAPAAPDDPPVAERSCGPVRPFSDTAARRRTDRARRTAEHAGRRGATTARLTAGPVRQWRAGWVDWLTCLGTVLVGAAVLWGDVGAWWRFGLVLIVGLGAALWLPELAAWRITADRSGLWVRGLRGPRHIAWDHILSVRCKGGELALDSRRVSFSRFSVHSFRWYRLEHRFGLMHPYERVAAEIDALWKDPALRPAEESPERARGWPLWPVSVVLAVAWVAALVWVA